MTRYRDANQNQFQYATLYSYAKQYTKPYAQAYATPVWGDNGISIPIQYFYFNDVGGPQNQYAIMNTNWTPNGLPFEVSVNAVPLTMDATERYLISSSVNPNVRYNAQNGLISSRFIDLLGGTAQSASPVQQGEQFAAADTHDGEGGVWTVNAGSVPYTELWAIGDANNIYNLIGGVPAANRQFHGPIWELKLTDNSPIQDTTVVYGDGIRYGALGQAITLAGDYDFEWDWIRTDQSGTGITGLFGTVGAGFRVQFRDSGASNPGQLRLNVDSVAWNLLGALDGIAIGQHVRCAIKRRLNKTTFEIDGVENPADTQALTGPLVLEIIGASDSISNIMTAGSAIQNVVLTDITNNLTYNYPLNETAASEQVGPELVANGHFTAGLTGWIPTSGVFWANSAVDIIHTTPEIALIQAGVGLTEIGKEYQVEFEILTYIGGTIHFRYGGVTGQDRSVPGVYTEIIVATAASGTLDFELSIGGFEGRIDNISVKEVAFPIANIDPSTQGNFLNQPLWDTTACFGNATRYGEIPAITLAQGDQWEISVDIIRQDLSGTGRQNIIGVIAGSAFRFTVYDTGSTTPNRVQLQSDDGSTLWDNAVADIAIGQHYNLRLVMGAANSVELFVDDISKGAQVRTGSFTFDAIGVYAATGPIPVGAAYQNIIITNITNSLRYEYKLDEGAGLDIINTDPGTAGPATNGAWTPDVDWQAIGPYSNDGVWTPDAVYTEVPLNSRDYPMNEGGGNILFDKLNPAARTTGPNLVTNGTFTTLDAWNTESGWSINTTKRYARFNGLPAATKLKQALPTVAGQTYIIDFDLQTLDGQAEQFAVGFGDDGITTTIGVGEPASVALLDERPGHKRVAIFAATDLTEFGFAAPQGAQIAVSNVEVYQAAAIDTDAVIQNYAENWDTYPAS